MKLQQNYNRGSSFKQRSHGYASLAMVAAIGITSLLGLLAVFRQGMRSHEAQTRNQIKIDYRQKEDALLRALVAIVPNKAVMAMKVGSAGDTGLEWNAIFVEAIEAAKAGNAVDLDSAIGSAIISSFGIGDDLFFANSGDIGDTASLLPSTFVDDLGGNDTLVGPGISGNNGLINNLALAGKLPPALEGGILANELLAPIITTQKTYPVGTPGLGADVTQYPLYNLIKYPDIRLGFATQGQDFIAKRNWWAFSLTFGNGVSLTNNTGTAATAIATVTKNYVLSIYEVPAQSAISAGGGTLQLGTGGVWAGATVTGNIFGAKVITGGASLGSGAMISARNTVSGTASVGAETLTSGADALGVAGSPGRRESRWASSGTEAYAGSDFYGMSDAGSSGRVAILPLSQGNQFLRMDGSAAADGSELSPTGWDEYAMGARQCSMVVEIVTCSTAANQQNKPTEIIFHYIKNTGLPATETLIMPPARGPGDPYPVYAPGNDVWENHDRDLWVNPDGSSDPSIVPFYWENLTNDGADPADASDPCLAIRLDRLPYFLEQLNAAGVQGTGINRNNTLLVWSNPDATGGAGVTKPSIPTAADEMGVVFRGANDLVNFISPLDGTAITGFMKGFSLVTDHRVYLAGDINQVPLALPAGSGLPVGTPHYPPLSIFAAEKRFGTSDTSVSSVTVAGQMASMVDDLGTTVNPLDLKVGVGDGSAISNLTSDLEQVLSPAQLPPINKMTWIVTIEEVGAGFAQ